MQGRCCSRCDAEDSVGICFPGATWLAFPDADRSVRQAFEDSQAAWRPAFQSQACMAAGRQASKPSASPWSAAASPVKGEPCVTASERGDSLGSLQMLCAVVVGPRLVSWKTSSAARAGPKMPASIKVRPFPRWVNRSPRNSVRVVSSWMTPASQPWGHEGCRCSGSACRRGRSPPRPPARGERGRPCPRGTPCSRSSRARPTPAAAPATRS